MSFKPKLTIEQIGQIMELRRKGVHLWNCANLYGVSTTTLARYLRMAEQEGYDFWGGKDVYKSYDKPRDNQSRIGKNYKDWSNHETDGIKVIRYAGYHPDSRHHMWEYQCKLCGNKGVTKSSCLNGMKSCGCYNANKAKEDPWSHELAKKWMRKPLCVN